MILEVQIQILGAHRLKRDKAFIFKKFQNIFMWKVDEAYFYIKE